MGRMIDETGHQYGYLTVLEPAPLPNRNKKGWRCYCSLCGNTDKVISGSDLRAHKYTSCGCKQQNCINEEPGTIYGNWKVLKRDETPAKTFPDKSVHWLCKCLLCGTVKSVSGRNLRTGNSVSCGCIRSHGENCISKYLNLNSIPFIHEYTITDLVGEKKNLRFDFAILNSNNSIDCLIEYQGIQHYNENNFFDSHNKDSFEKRQKYDEEKVYYCSKNNIPLYLIENKDGERQIENKINCIMDFILKDERSINNYGKISYIDLRNISCE